MAKRTANKIMEQFTEPKETKQKKEKIRLLTGATLRDIVLGGAPGIYGIQVGVIWNVIGISGGGKTFLTTELIAKNKFIYGDKFKWHYDDAEGGNEVDCRKLYGFDLIEKSLLKKDNKSVKSKTVEDLHMNIKKFLQKLKKDEIGCYVIDSLDALISDEIKNIIKEREKAFDKDDTYDEGSYLMQKAKYLKQQFFPDIKPLIEESNCLLIIVSQQSEKIGVTYGSKKDRAGGKALRFFAHYESWLRELEKIIVTVKGEKRAIGARNIENFTKTRNPRPFRDCKTTLFFDYGVSDLDTSLDFVFNLLTDGGKDKTGKDSEITFDQCSQLFDNKDDFFKIWKRKNATKKQLEKIDEVKDSSWYVKKQDLIEYIEKNNLEDVLKQMVIDKWEEIEEKVKITRKRKY